MAMPKMFRDRVVSMEQTWELGEKYLEILAELVHEALPRFRMVGNDFDHDRDFYVPHREGDPSPTRRSRSSSRGWSWRNAPPSLSSRRKRTRR